MIFYFVELLTIVNIAYTNKQKLKKMTTLDIKTTLEDLSNGACEAMRNLPIWSEIMQLADEKKHFCSEIVERVILDRKSISEKQAWVVAYFAKNNNLLTA